jgi:replication factor C subunit 2/4
MKERLLMIADNEKFSDQAKDLIDEILVQSEGDMRRAVTTLQSVHSLAFGGDVVSSDSIAEIAGLPPKKIVDELWRAVTQRASMTGSSTFDAMNQVVEDVCSSGYSAQTLLSALLTRVTMASSTNPTSCDVVRLSDLSKSRIAIRIAEAEKNMIDGADEYLQLLTVCSLILSCWQSEN